jgi:WD40 repeat protein
MEKVLVHKMHSFTGHRDGVYTLQPAASAQEFFSAAGDGMVVQWDLEKPDEGNLIAKLPNSIYALNYHALSNVLLAGHNYDGIHVLDWKEKKEIGSVHLTDAAIFDIQSLGHWVFVASGDGILTKIDLRNLSVSKKVAALDKSARTIAINKTKGEVAVGYSDNLIRVFDADTLQRKFEWEAHEKSVFTLRYTPDETMLLSGSRDARLKGWDALSHYHQAEEVVAHMYAINHVECSPDGKHFVTCSMDKSIKVWSFEELQLLKVIDKARHAGHGTSVNKVLWTNPRGLILSASDDRTISSWLINLETTS